MERKVKMPMKPKAMKKHMKTRGMEPARPASPKAPRSSRKAGSRTAC